MRLDLLELKLDEVLKSFNCSYFTKQLWSQVEKLDFETAVELRVWACKHIKVEIVWQGNFCTMMK